MGRNASNNNWVAVIVALVGLVGVILTAVLAFSSGQLAATNRIIEATMTAEARLTESAAMTAIALGASRSASAVEIPPTEPPAPPIATEAPTSLPATEVPTPAPATATETPTPPPATATATATSAPATPTETPTSPPATTTATATPVPATPTETPTQQAPTETIQTTIDGIWELKLVFEGSVSSDGVVSTKSTPSRESWMVALQQSGSNVDGHLISVRSEYYNACSSADIAGTIRDKELDLVVTFGVGCCPNQKADIVGNVSDDGFRVEGEYNPLKKAPAGNCTLSYGWLTGSRQ